MEEVRTATGITFPCDYFNIYAPTSQLNLRVLGTPLARVAAVFSSPAETVQLWYGPQYAAQYTRLVALVPETDAVRVVLERE